MAHHAPLRLLPPLALPPLLLLVGLLPSGGAALVVSSSLRQIRSRHHHHHHHPTAIATHQRRASACRLFGDGDGGSSGDATTASDEEADAKKQQKPKAKQDRFELQFTCNVCEHRNSHSISRHAYSKGTVIVTCPQCSSTHLIADHLSWIEDDFTKLEDFMAERGTPVKKIVRDNAAADAAAEAVARLMEELGEEAGEGEEEAQSPAGPSKIDGITDDQAMRIREAVRAAKRRKREEGGD